MRHLMIPLVLLGVAACGPEEGDFVAEYVEYRCEHMFACGDPAIYKFDGILNMESCRTFVESEVGAWRGGCKYLAGQAQVCLDDMSVLTCPGDGSVVDRPISCTDVYVSCGSEVDPSTSESPSEVPADDTDESSDTQAGAE